MIEALSDGTDFEYGFFFEPIDDENKALMNVQTNGVFMVNPRSKNFATALDFMQFWEKNGSIWAEKTYMPLCSGELPESVPEVIRMMTEEKKAGNIAHYGAFTEPLSSRFTIDYRNVLTAYAESLIGGNPMTPERCLAEMQKKFDLDITQK